MVECKQSIGPYLDAVGLASGRQAVLQVNHPTWPDLKAKGGVFHVVGQRRWVFVAKSVV